MNDFRNEVLAFVLVISFFFQWAVSFFTDHQRVFRTIIEDVILEIYSADTHKLNNLYLWINLRGLFVESFKSIDRDTVLLTDVFTTVRKLIQLKKFNTAESETLLDLTYVLENKLLREFRHYGVIESHLHVSSIMFYEAISYVLDIDGG